MSRLDLEKIPNDQRRQLGRVLRRVVAETMFGDGSGEDVARRALTRLAHDLDGEVALVDAEAAELCGREAPREPPSG